MSKERAIQILKNHGWQINAPEEIELVRVDDETNTAFLRQEGNGEWEVEDVGNNGVVWFTEYAG
jgi:hypothetical protein